MLRGKVAIITGSAQGLGKAFARALLERGSKVCLSDVNQELLETTSTELKSEYAENVFYQACDVTNIQQMEELFRKTKENLGSIDIVVNNAGIVHEKAWEKCIDINLNGTIRGTMLALEYLRKDMGGQGGLILNMSSLAGIFPVNYTPVYAASKHGVIGFTRSWANHPDVINNGVRLVCLCPAFVDTDMIKVEKDRFQGEDLVQPVLDKFGVMSLDQITTEFMKAVQDEDNNGSVISVTMRGAKTLNLPSPS
ncbi:15-hydroxyprostaglandin dehydrogenase [NAD(+)]-like [Ostrea edulis]|uniref:15-hydroxyprostaglandin dehydrogenase [NAD(+)]-like n=1 Tax=Ostrea edulis TaxID=37623 RepID=UPI002094BA08|nr:15-hydroxyprostaglandin dehydrogenase [NAD(+)]-like [Ostrea edulis]